MNLDNEQEAEMVDNLLKNECANFKPYIIGMRINPVVGGGAIAMMSTATKLSKFGLPLTEETKDRILELYQKYKWMNGIHFHVGSQGIPIELFVNGAKVSNFTSFRLYSYLFWSFFCQLLIFFI